MTKNQTRPPTIIKIVCKGLTACFLLWFLLYIMIFTIGFVAEERAYSGNLAEQVDGCNRYYYDRQYSELRDYLLLYDAYEDTFDLYWEIVEGYSDYMQYLQWAATPADKMPESTEMVEFYRQKIIENAENCAFEQNQKQLTAYEQAVLS